MEVKILSDAVLNFFIHNSSLHKASDFDKIYCDKHPSVYEVIRIIDGIPLFLEEHYERLSSSAVILGYRLDFDYEEQRKNILKMIEINKTQNYNIKIVVNNFNNDSSDTYYFFIKSNYPEEALYIHGIKTFLYKAVRENPNVKIINKNLREEVDRLLKEKGCYEALLVNNSGEITEGSRSNLFFIRDNSVFTSPSEGVLMGITRQRIISLCRKNGIEVKEVPISSEHVESFDAAFISGTSPKVLPVSTIDEYNYSTDNSLLIKIMKIYNDEIHNYITSHK
jgi:branched-chain amino acid aminotransferase